MMGVVQYLLLVLAYTHVSQVAGQWTCCDDNSMRINLMTGSFQNTADPPSFGIEVHENFTSGSAADCDFRGVLKVTFEVPHNCNDKCIATCDRRMLKIQLKIATDRQGYLLNIGNSPTNDGDKGDSNNHTYDSNLVMYNEDITVHANDNCDVSTQYTNATASTVTVNIASDYYRIRNSEGLDVSFCNGTCIFDFFGRNDTQLAGPNDFVLFVAFNRVVDQGSSRVGNGVCGARLSWECCEDD